MTQFEDLRQRFAVLDAPLFSISGTPVTLATLITFVVMVLVVFGLAGLTRRAVARVFTTKGEPDQGTAAIASRLARYAVLLVGLGAAIHHLGIDLTALFAAGAVFAVAFGFAMQNISQNFVSGVILLLERVIKPGDVVEVQGQVVQIKDMGIRATIARTLDEEEIIIPNLQLVSEAVTNYTFSDSLYRLRGEVGVVYSADLKLVRETLVKTAAALPWRKKGRTPRIQLKQFGDSSVNFEVSVWIEDPWTMQQRRNDLLEAIWWALKDADVTIAFPQLDLHLDPPVVAALRGDSGEEAE